MTGWADCPSWNPIPARVIALKQKNFFSLYSKYQRHHNSRPMSLRIHIHTHTRHKSQKHQLKSTNLDRTSRFHPLSAKTIPLSQLQGQLPGEPPIRCHSYAFLPCHYPRCRTRRTARMLFFVFHGLRDDCCDHCRCCHRPCSQSPGGTANGDLVVAPLLPPLLRACCCC